MSGILCDGIIVNESRDGGVLEYVVDKLVQGTALGPLFTQLTLKCHRVIVRSFRRLSLYLCNLEIVHYHGTHHTIVYSKINLASYLKFVTSLFNIVDGTNK